MNMDRKTQWLVSTKTFTREQQYLSKVCVRWGFSLTQVCFISFTGEVDRRCCALDGLISFLGNGGFPIEESDLVARPWLDMWLGDFCFFAIKSGKSLQEHNAIHRISSSSDFIRSNSSCSKIHIKSTSPLLSTILFMASWLGDVAMETASFACWEQGFPLPSLYCWAMVWTLAILLLKAPRSWTIVLPTLSHTRWTRLLFSLDSFNLKGQKHLKVRMLFKKTHLHHRKIQ